MGETQAKYHHLIPQTYMSAWANDAGTLEVEFLSNPGAFEPKNKDNIAGITDYHSIQFFKKVQNKITNTKHQY